MEGQGRLTMFMNPQTGTAAGFLLYGKENFTDMAIYKLKDFIALLLHCAWEAFNFFLNLDILTFWRDSETADWQYKDFLLYPYVYNFTVKNK